MDNLRQGELAEKSLNDYLVSGAVSSPDIWWFAASNPLKNPIRLQVPVRCRWIDLHFRGIADIVDSQGVWEIKYSALRPYALALISFPQLLVYAHGLSVPVAGVINLRRHEIIRIDEMPTAAVMEALRDCIRRHRDPQFRRPAESG